MILQQAPSWSINYMTEGNEHQLYAWPFAGISTTSSTYPPEEQKKSGSNWKKVVSLQGSLTYRKLKDHSLTCFEHQTNIIVVLLL